MAIGLVIMNSNAVGFGKFAKVACRPKEPNESHPNGGMTDGMSQAAGGVADTRYASCHLSLCISHSSLTSLKEHRDEDERHREKEAEMRMRDTGLKEVLPLSASKLRFNSALPSASRCLFLPGWRSRQATTTKQTITKLTRRSSLRVLMLREARTSTARCVYFRLSSTSKRPLTPPPHCLPYSRSPSACSS
jgi:hypothetical protein